MLRRPGKAGLGAAYRAGFRVAIDDGAEICVQMDADLSHDPRCAAGARRHRRARRRPGDRQPLRARRASPRTGRGTAGRCRAGATATPPACSAWRSTTPPPGTAPTRADALRADGLRHGGGRRLRLPGRDDLPARPPRRQGRRVPDHVPRPHRRRVEDVAATSSARPSCWCSSCGRRTCAAVASGGACGGVSAVSRRAGRSCTSTWTRSTCRVELRRRPELRGQPVVVGGTGPRGVVAAASYEARRYGVHSAMPSTHGPPAVPARRVPARRPRPVRARSAREVHAIFRDVTPLVEPLSLDEAFLDVTGCRAPARRRPDDRRARSAGAVADELELSLLGRASPRTSSSPSWPRRRPSRGRRRRACGPGRGVVEVPPGRGAGVPAPAAGAGAVGRRPGDARAGSSASASRTVGDLAELDEAVLVGALGEAHGRHLHRLALGASTTGRSSPTGRPSRSATRRRSPTDRVTHDELRRRDGPPGRRRRRPAARATASAARTVTLKVRFAGFRTITRSATLPAPVDTARDLVAVGDPPARRRRPDARACACSGVQRQQLRRRPPSSSASTPCSTRRATVDAAGRTGVALRRAAVDEIRARFGHDVIGPASAVRGRQLRSCAVARSSGVRVVSPVAPDRDPPG